MRLRRRFVHAAAFAAAIVVPAIASAQDLGCDFGDLEVRSLEFRGNRAVGDDELALRVLTTPSALLRRSLRIGLGMKRCLNRLYLPRDLFSLEAYYRERGYYEAKIDTIVRPIGKDGVGVVFTIVEGAPTILKSYQVLGLTGLRDSAAVVSNLRLRTGEAFDVGLYGADMDSIVRRLRNFGYPRATTFQSFGRFSDSLLARAVIQVSTGRRARFAPSQIKVTPVDRRGQRVPDDVVRRVMGIAPGTVYSDRAITEAQRSLFQLGVYRHVEVEPLADSLQPAGDTIVILGVTLTEDFMKHLETEYGWATLDCGRVRAQYRDLNFLRSARRFELTGQASKIGFGAPLANTTTRGMCTFPEGAQSPLSLDSAFSDTLHYFAGVSLRQPRLLGTRWVPTLSLYSERRGEFKAFLRQTTIGTDISATRDIGDRTQFRIGFTEEFGQTRAPDAVLCALFSRCDEAERQQITSKAKLGVGSATISRVHTDNLLSPARGTILRAEVRSSASSRLFTDSALVFNKASTDLAYYMPFGWHNVLSLRLRAGAVMGRSFNDSLAFIPPQERLYAGGATSIRGYQQNELGDVVYIARNADVVKAGTDPDTFSVAAAAPFDRVVPLGGNTLFVANLEYRVRDAFIFPNLLQYAFFLDAGDVWNRPAKPTFKVTPGFGLRALTPIGPIQINVGYNRYLRPTGPLYYEDPTLAGTAISPLYCVSPGNAIPLTVLPGGTRQPPAGAGCPATYTPRQRTRFIQKLAFTIQIGPDF